MGNTLRYSRMMKSRSSTRPTDLSITGHQSTRLARTSLRSHLKLNSVKLRSNDVSAE